MPEQPTQEEQSPPTDQQETEEPESVTVVIDTGEKTTATLVPVNKDFTKDDFSTEKPYAYLYSIKDRFRQQMALEHVREIAKKEKVVGLFDRMWKQYLASRGASRDIYRAENRAALTGFKYEQPKTGEEYEVTDDGIIYFSPDGFGSVTVCPHPIVPVTRIVNIDTGEYKIELAFRRGKFWRTAIIEKAVLASAQRIVQLASFGIAVDSESARLLVTYLSRIETLNYDQMKEISSVGRLGWIKAVVRKDENGELEEKEGFSPYVDDIIFDGTEQYRHAFEAVRPHGSEETWMKLAKEVRAGPSVAARIMLAASFASALVAPLNALPFMVHTWSYKSGIGKTVGLMLAASVWADPNVGDYVKSFNSTSVGIEMMAGFCGSLPVCIDELCLKDGRRDQFDSLIYHFCEGVGRTRGSRNGGLQKTLTWRNCAITTGEEPLTSGNSKAGAVNRVLEIDAGEVKMFEDPVAAVQILQKNYGFAGKRFIEVLLLHKDLFILSLQTTQQILVSEMEGKATDKQAQSASIIIATDRFITEHIFRDGRALTVEEILPNLQTPDAANINRRCYNWLIDMVGANPGRFEPKDDGTYAGECWGVAEWENDQVFIISSIFDRLLKEEGFNSNGFLKWAAREHLLVRTDDRHKTIQKRLEGGRKIRCICLKIRDQEEDAEENKEQPIGQTSMDAFAAVSDEDLPF